MSDEQFRIKQRIKELEKAIARDPEGKVSDVHNRRRELETLKEQLKE
jgi:hypothetical protein